MSFAGLPNFGKMGVNLTASGGSIRVYSANATRVTLCILDADNPSLTVSEIELARHDDEIWFAESSNIKAGIKYVLRADGPSGPRHSFNPEIDLIDPYARGVVRENARDYHCVAVSQPFDWQGVSKPKTPLDQTIIYEAHARGLTRGNSALPDEIRGTYAALGHESTIAHLQKIGVTAIELLPIHMFISEPRLMNMGLINYWGYNSINFFSPHPRYASASSLNAGPEAIIAELKTSIRELHRAGIEVYLDVVYNHTAEGGARGLTYSYRGLDNSSYYRQDDAGNYHDTTGCGNSLNFGNPHVIHLVLESLRYWTEEMQIDGYRFDLASTLARDVNNHFNPNHPLLRAITEDPTFADAKMIVEPWDVGLGGWQTGNYPDRFSEWNDRYRDSVRQFWVSDIALARNGGNYWNGVADIATKLAGSQDVVDGPGGVLGGVNFITAHDGFTLRDLVSYNVKHNQVNGESNRDGTNNNYSFNFGVEGETSDQTVNEQRRRTMRNLLGTLLLSSGIPMVSAGDERGKTQHGNNNAYCQDTSLSWVNWGLSKADENLEATFAHLTKLRRSHPVLRPNAFSNHTVATDDSDLTLWFNKQGELMNQEDWENPECRTVLRFSEHLASDGSTEKMLLVVHGAEADDFVTLPAYMEISEYKLLWDSFDELPPTTIKSLPAAQKVRVSGLSMQLYRAE